MKKTIESFRPERGRDGGRLRRESSFRQFSILSSNKFGKGRGKKLKRSGAARWGYLGEGREEGREGDNGVGL